MPHPRDAESAGPPEVRAPVEAGAGVLVHSRQERELAVGTWLLAATENVREARRQWQGCGMALLRCGGLFGAIRISTSLVRAAAGTDEARRIDGFLASALLGGPVIVDQYAQWYYALVPASAGRRQEWRVYRGDPEVEFLGRDCFLGVPRPDVTTPEGVRSYWCVPMDGPGDLAVPDAVFQLLAVARFRRAR